MQDRKFLDFIDMFDGGGAGRRGDEFEGGGLYSLLANAIADPYGSQDEERRAERDKFYGIVDMASGMPPAPMRQAPAPAMGPAPSAPDMSMPSIPGYTTPEPQSDYPGMGMSSIPGYTAPASGALSDAQQAATQSVQGSQVVPTGDSSYTSIIQKLNDPNTSPLEYSYLQAQLEMMQTGRYPVGY